MSPIHVLFVCTANICRSPYMELVARQRLGDRALVTVASAGTHGWEGKGMNGTMAATLSADVGYDEFISRQLTGAMIDEADLVLTADRGHRSYVLEEYPAAFRKVFTLGQFAEVVHRLPGVSGRELITAASRLHGISHVHADVADPFRRGSKAAAACATEIGTLLDVVLPALSGDSPT